MNYEEILLNLSNGNIHHRDMLGYYGLALEELRNMVEDASLNKTVAIVKQMYTILNTLNIIILNDGEYSETHTDKMVNRFDFTDSLSQDIRYLRAVKYLIDAQHEELLFIDR